nr:6049_t:CDS:2 [Entrophospora candida]
MNKQLQQIGNLNEILDNIFPTQNDVFPVKRDNNNQITSESGNGDFESILHTRGSIEIWQQISNDSNETPFQWKKSLIRKEFYAALGISIEIFEETKLKANLNLNNVEMSNITSSSTNATKVTNKSTTSLSAPVSRSTSPTPTPPSSFSQRDLLSSSIITTTKNNNNPMPKEPKKVDVDLAKSLCSIPEASQLLAFKSQLLALSRQTSDVLTYWLDQREQTMMDSETYNQMIECLVGHAQKMRDGSGNRWDKLKKPKNKSISGGVTSGFASLSLSFMKQKSSLQDSYNNNSNNDQKFDGKELNDRPISM